MTSGGRVSTEGPDHVGWIHVIGPDGALRGSHEVRIWLASDVPTAPDEWTSFVEVRGAPGWDPRRPIPAGSPLQANMLAFVRVHLLERDLGGFVSDFPASRFGGSGA